MSDGRRASELGKQRQEEGTAQEQNPVSCPRLQCLSAPTSRLIFSASSFLPLKAATQRRILRAFTVLPDRTIQRMDSGIHLEVRVRTQWLTPHRKPL